MTRRGRGGISLTPTAVVGVISRIATIAWEPISSHAKEGIRHPKPNSKSRFW